jgi:hypothetical protein
MFIMLGRLIRLLGLEISLFGFDVGLKSFDLRAVALLRQSSDLRTQTDNLVLERPAVRLPADRREPLNPHIPISARTPCPPQPRHSNMEPGSLSSAQGSIDFW